MSYRLTGTYQLSGEINCPHHSVKTHNHHHPHCPEKTSNLTSIDMLLNEQGKCDQNLPERLHIMLVYNITHLTQCIFADWPNSASKLLSCKMLI